MFRTDIISTIASWAHTLNYSIYLDSVSIIFLPYTKRPGANGANCLQDFPVRTTCPKSRPQERHHLRFEIARQTIFLPHKSSIGLN